MSDYSKKLSEEVKGRTLDLNDSRVYNDTMNDSTSHWLVRKRNGTITEFNLDKIMIAISNAFEFVLTEEFKSKYNYEFDGCFWLNIPWCDEEELNTTNNFDYDYLVVRYSNACCDLAKYLLNYNSYINDSEKYGERIKKTANKIKRAVDNLGDVINTVIIRLSLSVERQLRFDSIYPDNNVNDKVVFNIEMIQDKVENILMDFDKEIAKEYITYRHKRKLLREFNTTDRSILELIDGTNDYWNNENSNKNAKLVTTQRDYLAGITSTDISKRFLLPKDIVDAHEQGIIHFHDIDYFAQNTLSNCCLINLEDMLQNGTVVNDVMIEKPHRFITAMTIATQIITAVASSQYGGSTISLTHLAPFVRDSYRYYFEKYIERGFSTSESALYAEQDTHKEIVDGVQTFNYQINSMATTNGQTPFLSVFMYLGETDEYKKELADIIEEFLKQRIQGMKNQVGVYVTQAFPKLLYVLEEDNINEDGKYYYLTKLASKCTAKRLVPDYISEKMMKKYKDGDIFPCMGCRSFLPPWKDENGNSKYYGRFNQGVVTINLADVALSSNKDENVFWKLLDERLELCHKALRCRHERLKNTVSDVAPILWQYGAFTRLEQGETIDKYLFDSYSSISLGYAALYECVKYMTGCSHSHGVGFSFGIKVMQKLNDKCNEWKEKENIGYSVYGSPIESVTYKFAKCLKERFGIIEGITDKNYVTNSYHVPVFEKINPFTKLEIESHYQALSLGGAISYIECADLQNNVESVIEVLKFIYDNIMYAELNTKSDYCQVCGFDGEIKIIDKDNELTWQCPNCGNSDKDKMNVSRRTCGYIGSNFWNQGRTQEIKERYVHLDNHSAGEDEIEIRRYKKD